MTPRNKNSIFALVDANNFFVSCERLFNPALRGKPVVVLSNNDGCLISRSDEAKTLGLPMGAPFFKYKKLIDDNNVAVFSSNYQLYSDISQRIMGLLQSLIPDIEVYSVDEAFLSFDKFFTGTEETLKYAKYVRQKVEQSVGIPLSMGLGPTKTLAKVASFMAKKSKEKLFDITNNPITQEEILAKLPVGEIWGVGRRWRETLNSLGIITALDLRQRDPKMIRKRLSVVGERMVFELRGVSCLELEDPKPRKNIISSRSFGRLTDKIEELEEAISSYTAKAAVKLRMQSSKAQGICIFLKTSRFNQWERKYSASTVKNFLVPTNDTRELISRAKEGLREIYNPHYQYQKTGIILLNLLPENNGQQNFFLGGSSTEKSRLLMSTIDQINKCLGKEAVFIASQGTQRPWQMKAQMRSDCFTTKWSELCVVS